MTSHPYSSSPAFLRNYPASRLRRWRQSPALRGLVAEHTLDARDLIEPLFFLDEEDARVHILKMPGIERLGYNQLVEHIGRSLKSGITSFAIFPIIDAALKCDKGVLGYGSKNPVLRAIDRCKQRYGSSINIICDLALDPFTSHGHDGILVAPKHAWPTDAKELVVGNDETIDCLCQQAISYCKAGADILAPSDMMDGRIGMVRAALDQNGYPNVPLLAYSAKYASHFYGPFRSALKDRHIDASTKTLGKQTSLMGVGLDKRGYQMDPRNGNEAIQEILMDINEGADAVIVKPGMMYLDICLRASQLNVPVFGYQVSGEYSMIQLAIEHECIQPMAIEESLMAFKRAGCRGIITYFAQRVAEAL